MNTDLLGQAVAALRLRDIVLHAARFSRPNLLPAPVVEGTEQTKRQVQFARGTIEENGEVKELLQVLVELGVRIVASNESAEPEPTVLLEVEADFIAEYQLLGQVSEEAIRLFADFNSVHNVWPFWRQHVFDIVQRARLPAIEIPLFAGPSQKIENRPEQTTERTSSVA